VQRLVRRLLGIPIRAEEVQRYVRLVPHHPTIVRLGRDIEEVART
jgi:hypothetical protein